MKKLLKKIVFKLKGGYKPKIFWEKWGKTFFKDPYQRKIFSQQNWLYQKISEIDPNSILEVGCGFGRNIKFLSGKGIPVRKITGVDISSTMLENCRRYFKNAQLKLILADIVELPLRDKSISLTFSHGVLMHIPPEKLMESVKEIFRVTKDYFLCVEQNYNGNEYTFVHDYQHLFSQLGGKILEKKSDKKGLDLYLVKIVR